MKNNKCFRSFCETWLEDNEKCRFRKKEKKTELLITECVGTQQGEHIWNDFFE